MSTRESPDRKPGSNRLFSSAEDISFIIWMSLQGKIGYTLVLYLMMVSLAANDQRYVEFVDII